MHPVIISVANNKGGVGKTTLSVTLAHSLATRGKKVLVVDMDSQCNATTILSSGLEKGESTLYELLDSDVPVSKCVYPTPYQNVDLLPNTENTAWLEADLYKDMERNYYVLRKKLRAFALSNYDITILDCPPNMGIFVVMSLITSDFCIVPVEGDSRRSLEGLSKAIATIRTIKRSQNPDLRFLRLLINRVDKRLLVCRMMLKYITSMFEEEDIFFSMIPPTTDFKQAEGYNETLLRFKPTSSGAKAYAALAKELIAILEADHGKTANLG